jgi:hypothetical protein
MGPLSTASQLFPDRGPCHLSMALPVETVQRVDQRSRSVSRSNNEPGSAF